MVIPSPWRVSDEVRSNGGDLLGMLRLPEDQKVFAPQAVVAHKVSSVENGGPWSASIGSEVVLLGDSFTNIYSDSSLGWGASAGFADATAGRSRPAGSAMSSASAISGSLMPTK